MTARAKGNTIFGLAVSLAISASALGCAETVAMDKTALELQMARREAWQKDQRVRALEWQMASLGQQVQATLQRDEAAQRELMARIQELTTANTALSDRLKKAEEEHAIAAAAPPPDNSKDRRPRGEAARADDLRRLQATLEARNAKLGEALARIEKLLQDQAARDSASRPKRSLSGELVDPWGFGERK